MKPVICIRFAHCCQMSKYKVIRDGINLRLHVMGKGVFMVSGKLSSSCLGPRVKPEPKGTGTAQQKKESQVLG